MPSMNKAPLIALLFWSAHALPQSRIFLAGEAHNFAGHDRIEIALIKSSALNQICLALEGFTPEEAELARGDSQACFFGFGDDILDKMGVFLKSYILLLEPDAADQKAGESALRLVFSEGQPLPEILSQSLENLNIDILEIRAAPSLRKEAETIKAIAREMSRIASRRRLLPPELIEIYDFTIDNPKENARFVYKFLMEARDRAWSGRIAEIYQKAAAKKKALVVYTGSLHLKGLARLLGARGIETSEYDLTNCARQRQFEALLSLEEGACY